MERPSYQAIYKFSMDKSEKPISLYFCTQQLNGENNHFFVKVNSTIRELRGGIYLFLIEDFGKKMYDFGKKPLTVIANIYILKLTYCAS